MLITKVRIFFKSNFFIFIQAAFRYLIKNLKASIFLEFQSLDTIKLALLVVFNIFVFIVYFMLWLPLD